jgi:hypothetical protein
MMWMLLSWSCASHHEPAEPAPVPVEAPPWRALLDTVTAAYPAWGQVDDQLRWAPYDCMAPPLPTARVSQGGETAHGQKIYTLYAMDPAAYGFPAWGGAPAPVPGVAQAIVKVAYQPISVEDLQRRPPREQRELDLPPRLLPAVVDGVSYVPDERLGLFVMVRLAEGQDEAGTDQGWIYATTTASGEVTAAGDLPSCRGCHERAGPDRLFGVDAP